jgi:cytochrome c oxidase accessory protein FixG
MTAEPPVHDTAGAAPASGPTAPEGRILSTMREDGSRRWLYPRPSAGTFMRARRYLAWVLIAIFTLLPYARISGKPAILLDLPHREFTVFGFTFLSTDTLLLALALLTLILGICLTTALGGRMWCGWMCPQTVYLEFVFRPIERFFDGPAGAGHRWGRKRSVPRTVAKYAIYLAISLYLAHTFLAYFVGVEELARWVRRSPLEHPVSFFVMAAVTGLMMFDFSYFREQTCIVACPYGRLQSVMLDRDSLIVSYDPRRGEPRGKLRDRKTGTFGDCIDCGLCTDTCPTGIDIRDGLQMECIACTQCIDACDNVMTRIGKPKGLIRLSSQAAIEREHRRTLRPRVILYPALIIVLIAAFAFVLLNKKSADVTLLPGVGPLFSETSPGQITNQLRLVIENRSGCDAIYRIEILGDGSAHFARPPEPIAIAAGANARTPLAVVAPDTAFTRGLCDIRLRVSDDKDFHQVIACRLLGPVRKAANSK